MMMSPFWVIICAFVFLLISGVGPSFQNTFCNKLENVPTVKQLDIGSITKTTDGHLLILQENSLYQLPLTSLDSLKHHFVDTTSQLLHFDWLRMPDESLREHYRLTRLEVLPTGGDKTVYHARYDPHKPSHFAENYFYDVRTLEHLKNFVEVEMPSKEYQTVMNGHDLEGYMFEMSNDGVKVKDLKSELLKSQNRPEFHIELSKDWLSFIKPTKRSRKWRDKGWEKFFGFRPLSQDLTTTLPVGFIHERQVYLLNLATEEVTIFPYEPLTDIDPNEKPPHSVQCSESLSIQAFFHCANRTSVESNSGELAGLSGPVQVAILFGGLALVGLLIGILVLVVKLARGSNQSGQIANYKAKSGSTTTLKQNKVQKMKLKKTPKQTSTGTNTSTTSTGSSKGTTLKK